MTRRTALVAGGALAIGAVTLNASRKPDRGGVHSAYFANLSKALKAEGIAHPVLVVDLPRLNANIAAIKASTDAAKLPLRVVAKSLPSPQLLQAVATGMGSNRLMVFSTAMLDQLLPFFADGDVLMGKPLPVTEVARLLDSKGPAAAQVQWLADTPQRFAELRELAEARNLNLRINAEIDVGLHRGGFADPARLAAVLKADNAGATLSGLMGYDPHLPKMRDPANAFAESQSVYRSFIDMLNSIGFSNSARLTLNAAGSPTFRYHAKATVGNEVSVGSAFVKPGDFDLPDLTDLQPAAYIATPVIKATGDLRLPGNDWLSAPLKFLDANQERAFFIHGGHWLATPTSPPGLQYSDLYGRSSNQEMLTGSARIALKPDDHIFLRPNQSEALFLQFGDLVVYDGRRITGIWPTLPMSA